MHRTTKWAAASELFRTPRRNRHVRTVMVHLTKDGVPDSNRVTSDDLDMLREVTDPMVAVMEVRKTLLNERDVIIVDFVSDATDDVITASLQMMFDRMDVLTRPRVEPRTTYIDADVLLAMAVHSSD